MTHGEIPHLPVVVGACIAAVAGYAVFSVYAVVGLKDATMTGDIIGTWKSFAVLAFGFWLGSSSGGKGKEAPAPPANAREPAERVAGTATDEADAIKGDKP